MDTNCIQIVYITSLVQEGLQSGKGCAFCCNRNKDTLLIIATKLGHVEAVNVLLDHFGSKISSI